MQRKGPRQDDWREQTAAGSRAEKRIVRGEESDGGRGGEGTGKKNLPEGRRAGFGTSIMNGIADT